jgi:hypothetical protein
MNYEKALPSFKYQPNCIENDIFIKAGQDEVKICQCCDKQIEIYYNTMYTSKNVDCLCPDCIANGSAAEKFDGEFIGGADPITDGADKTEELFKRTPGYVSWQEDYWLAHCNDYCAFISYVGIKELQEMGIIDEVLADYAEMDDNVADVRQWLHKEGWMVGYLFKCLHCGKHRLWVDSN